MKKYDLETCLTLIIIQLLLVVAVASGSHGNFTSCSDRSGSFYGGLGDKEHSDYLIGERKCFDRMGSVVSATDFFTINIPERLKKQNISWLMIGDSTEERILKTACGIFRDISNKPKANDFGLLNVSMYNPSKNRRNWICRLRYSDNRWFTFGSVFIFGYERRIKWSELFIGMINTTTAFDGVYDTHDIIIRALNDSFLLRHFETSSLDLISIHACLWDENEHENLIEKGIYKEELIKRYREGFIESALTVREESMKARFVASTCKPVKRLDRFAESGSVRPHHLQVAFDNVVKEAVMQHNDLVDGILDASSILSGYEYYAKDGRHYEGRGASTLFNQYLQFLL